LEIRPELVAGEIEPLGGGRSGSLALLLRKRWAKPLFVLSSLGLFAQDIALFSRPEVRGDLVVIFLQGLVFAIALSLLMLSRKAEREGWLG
jgi:hypothetical protein